MTDGGKGALYDMIATPAGADTPAGDTLQRALQVIRAHMGMEVAYVSEFVDNRSVFRQVDAPGLEAMIKPGDTMSLDDVYCRHILEGRLPELIPDTSQEPFAAAMPITQAVPIGAHMSVPIRMPDGSAYGMFCCVGTQANPSLNARDLQMMRAFADLAAFEISRDIGAKKEAQESYERVQSVIADASFSMVYQPICDAETREPMGLECLARFSAAPQRTPDLWFKEAATAGLGVELELAALRKAFEGFKAPLPPTLYISANASPDTVLSPVFADVFAGLSLDRIVLEITEHAHVADYTALHAVLTPLRVRGLRIAVDDAGAGYSGLQHILALQPDMIKLDMSLTRHVDIDPVRQALGAALIRFANETNSHIVAEGVETESELRALKSLGVTRVQGYLTGRPMTIDAAVNLFQPHNAVQVA